MSRNVVCLLLLWSVFLSLQGTQSVIVDPPEDDQKQCCDTSVETLTLVKQMASRMTSLEDKLQTQFANLKTEMDEKLELYVTRLENKLVDKLELTKSSIVDSVDKQIVAMETENKLNVADLESKMVDEFRIVDGKLTSSEAKIQGLEGQLNIVNTNNELSITRLENKLSDELETTKTSLVDSILSGSKYELTLNNDRLIEGINDKLIDIRQTLLSDGQTYVDMFANVTKNVKTSMEDASSSLIYSSLSLSSNLTMTLKEFQTYFVVENKKSLSSLQNFTDDLSKSIEEAAASVTDIARNISFSVAQNERNILNLADKVNSQVADSVVKLNTIVGDGMVDLKETFNAALGNQSIILNQLSTFFPTIENNKLVLEYLLNQSCHRNMLPYPLSFEKYTILHKNTEVLDTPILCDALTEGGGWIVIQRRVNWDISFYRDWQAYKEGFGSLTGDFWFGLDNIHKLTSSAKYELRVDLKYNDKSGYAKYSSFEIGSESEKYKLALGSYSGTAGDDMTYNNGKKFSTHDHDNDGWKSDNCASRNGGAWWYWTCSLVQLNGKKEETKRYYGAEWHHFSDGYSVTFSEMKIRKI